jgi:sterol desaturase/sphingolipid hydroxylase (fatty acid hydroxylase superfamily)
MAMQHAIPDGLIAQYNWQLSLVTAAAVLALTLGLGKLALVVPAFRAADRLNRDALAAKMAKPAYAANQRLNRAWSLVYMIVIFGAIMPFCVTLAPQPWWRIPVDCVAILMVYDFVYYLTHRFLFHDAGFLGGPLIWMHAIHHRQHNPCRGDSSYLHPLEVAIGLGLYMATIFVLSRFVGPFHLATVIVTWLAFTQINLHNHDLWDATRFPGRYLNTMSAMHHNHHAKFTGGNYATITLLYDWMFGTLDYGDKTRRPPARYRGASQGVVSQEA